MTLPMTEVLIFDTSDSFRANPELLAPTFDRLKEDGMNVSWYSGLEAENPNVGYVFINWDSHEHRKAVTDASPELLKGLQQAHASPSKAYHVQFPAPPVALDHPITVVLILTLKDPENSTALIDVLTNLSVEGKERTVLEFGQTLEGENKYIILGGWPSVEAHREASKEEAPKAAKALMLSLANPDKFGHVELRRF